MNPTQRIHRRLHQLALENGFDCIGIAPAYHAKSTKSEIKRFVALERYGSMAWMARNLLKRLNPREIDPTVRCIAMLGINYGYPLPSKRSGHATGKICTYALGEDYHSIIRQRLKLLSGRINELCTDEKIERSADSARCRVFVDSAPVLEKPLAQAAGIGWQGKHTNLVSRNFGSYLLLGVIFLPFDLPPGPPALDRCGRCRACIDVCPSRAIVAPYRLDARRCISYLTIENRGHIPRSMRRKIGDHIFGCDLCLDVCPWNRFAQEARNDPLHSQGRRREFSLSELLSLTPASFVRRFEKTAIMRIGFVGLLRNTLIVSGNSADRSLLPGIIRWLPADDPRLRVAATWAFSQLADQDMFSHHYAHRIVVETDANVRSEWEQCMKDRQSLK